MYCARCGEPPPPFPRGARRDVRRTSQPGMFWRAIRGWTADGQKTRGAGNFLGTSSLVRVGVLSWVRVHRLACAPLRRGDTNAHSQRFPIYRGPSRPASKHACALNVVVVLIFFVWRAHRDSANGKKNCGETWKHTAVWCVQDASFTSKYTWHQYTIEKKWGLLRAFAGRIA